MSVMLCMGATFVRKNYCLVARIFSFDAAGLYLFTSIILEPKCFRIFSRPKILKFISVTLSHISNISMVLCNHVFFESTVSRFPAAKTRFFKAMLWWKYGTSRLLRMKLAFTSG